MINKEELFLPNRWQCYIGIVTESTVTKNQRWFHIYIPELLPTVTGDVTPEFATIKTHIDNVWKGTPVAQDGYTPNQLIPKSEDSEIKITKTVYADYFGFDTNQDVPTMYRDMQVMALNFANTDKWYWIPLERDRSYKTFEHVRISALNQALTNKSTDATKDDIEKRNKVIGDSNCYYFEIDTKYNKHIKIATSASDGEQFLYFFEIDPVNHKIEIWDTAVDGSQKNNTIKIESTPDKDRHGRITLQNGDCNSIILDGPDTIINIPRNLIMNVGGDTLITRKGNYAENIVKDYAKTIEGKESRTTVGLTNHKYMNNYADVYMMNKQTTIMQTHMESQSIRTTISKTASWVSEVSWSLATTTCTTVFKLWQHMADTMITEVENYTLAASKATITYGQLTAGVVTKLFITAPIHTILPLIPYFFIF